MSIKILKNTRIEPVEVTCPNCLSVFSYTYDEVQRSPRYNCLGFTEGTDIYVVCPVCKCNVDRSPRVVLKEDGNEND